MDIIVHHLVIHELIKKADEADAQLFLSEQLAPKDERVAELVAHLHGAFEQKSDVLQGFLAAPEDALFPGYFQLLQEQQLNEEAFLAFSKDTMQALQLSLQGVIGAKGGYLVYAYYQADERQFTGIFMVRDNEGIVFQKQQETQHFSLHPVTYLNTDKLAMAARIDLSRSQQAQGRYLELIKYAKSQKEISEYFTNWIGLDQPVTSKELTQSFLEMVEVLPTPEDEETGVPLQRQEFREQVMQFAMESPNKTISVQAFDEQFYGNEKPAQEFLSQTNIDFNEEFRYDRNAMKRYYQVKASANNISLQFNRNDYDEGAISIEGNQIIIEDPELVEKLREQLFKEES